MIDFDLYFSNGPSRTPSIVRRPNSAKIPRSDADWDLPFHAPNMVGHELNVNIIRSMMTEQVRQRFDYVVDLTFNPPDSSSNVHCASQLNIPAGHSEALLLGDIAELADDTPTRAEVICFPTIEEKLNAAGELAPRLRPIAWPRSENARVYADGYVPKVDLPHISKFLSQIHDGSKVTCRDATASFFLFVIPPHARSLFRFRDASGRLLQYKRLPMGHVCSPEIIHTLISTVVGHPDFCTPDWAAPSTWTVRNWIDDTSIISDADADVPAFLQARAEVSGIWWKTTDAVNLDDACVWAGLHWDFSSKLVSVGPKLRRKLQDVDVNTMTLGDLHTFVSRLVFAAGAVNIPLCDSYLALKIARRRLRLVQVPDDYSSPANLPAATVQELVNLRNDVLSARNVPPRSFFGGTATLFSDASLVGWGAILFLSCGKVLITGSRWPPGTPSESGDISMLESLAISLALADFSSALAEGDDGNLRILVDNTSTQAALINGRGRAARVNEAIRPAIGSLQSLRRRFLTTVGYIPSEFNPADAISRGSAPSIDFTRVVVDYLRLGGGAEARDTRFF